MVQNAAWVKCVAVSICIVKVTALNLVKTHVNPIATVHQVSFVVVPMRLACVAGGQAVKNRAGERPPARFGFVFQVPWVPPTSLYFVINQSTNTKYIFKTLTENYVTLDNTVINSSYNLI